MHLAWYAQDVLVGGDLTVDSCVGFTGRSVLRPCLESPVASSCQGPGPDARYLEIFHKWQNSSLSSWSKFLAKKTEDMSWKARWIVALVREEAVIKPSVQPSTCPRAVIFTPSICSCKSVARKDRTSKDWYSCLWKWNLHPWLRF